MKMIINKIKNYFFMNYGVNMPTRVVVMALIILILLVVLIVSLIINRDLLSLSNNSQSEIPSDVSNMNLQALP